MHFSLRAVLFLQLAVFASVAVDFEELETIVVDLSIDYYFLTGENVYFEQLLEFAEDELGPFESYIFAKVVTFSRRYIHLWIHKFGGEYRLHGYLHGSTASEAIDKNVQMYKTGLKGDIEFVHIGEMFCSDVPVVVNGRIDDGGSNLGDRRRIFCNYGFVLKGNNETACLHSREWSTNFRCEPSDNSQPNCGQTAPSVPNGQVGDGGVNVGNSRHVTCNAGYKLVGEHDIVCRPDLQWSTPGICQPVLPDVTCGNAPLISNGETGKRFSIRNIQNGPFTSRYSVGERLPVVCNPGYVLHGNSEISCQKNGQWTTAGQCNKKIVSCGSLPSVENGRILSGGTNAGDRRQIICYTNFVIYGDATITCGADGAWSTPGTCKQKTCSDVPDINFGRIAPGGSSVSDRRRIKCDRGYVLRGSNDIYCQQDGTWSEPGYCQQEVKSCGEVPFVSSGRVERGSSIVGSRRQIACDQDYEISGTDEIECQDNGEWSRPGECRMLPVCGHAPELSNARVVEDIHATYSVGHRLRVHCHDDYHMVGGEYIVCESHGEWSHWSGYCEHQVTGTCSDVPTVKFGHIEPGESKVSDRRRIKCDPGYVLLGSNNIYCQQDGVWSEPGYCYRELERCGEVPFVRSGRVERGGSYAGDRRRILCDQDYEISGTDEIECQDNGEWSRPGECRMLPGIHIVVTCGATPYLPNGYVSSGGFNEGEIRQVFCNSGFNHRGRSSITCRSDATWSDPGYCYQATCRLLPYIGHGRFEEGGSSVGDRRQVICDAGYAMRGSSEIICLAQGLWSLPGKCEEIPQFCGAVVGIRNGRIESSGDRSQVGTVLRIVCDYGFVNRGHLEVYCQADGSWSTPGQCEQESMSCGAIPFIDNGQISPGGSRVGDRRRLSCYSGYELRGNSEFVCQSSGKWSAVGYCEQRRPSVSCGNTPFLAYGRISAGGFRVRDRRGIYCDRGFRLLGNHEITCQQNGTWSSPGYCVPERTVTCDEIPTVANSQIQQGGSNVGDLRSIVCDSGYTLQGISEVVCQPNGHWSARGHCERDRDTYCGSVPYITSGRVEQGGSRPGDRRRISCTPGTNLRGNYLIVCQENGEWSAPGHCERRRSLTANACGQLPHIAYGRVGDGGYEVGERRSVSCAPGYTLQGNMHIICQQNSQWSEPGYCYAALQPESGCNSVPLIPNGRISSGFSQVGSHRFIVCDNGYYLEGPRTIRCQRDFTWSRPEAICVRHVRRSIDCSDVTPYVTNGLVEEGCSDIDCRRTVLCNSGYKLVNGEAASCRADGQWHIDAKCVEAEQ